MQAAWHWRVGAALGWAGLIWFESSHQVGQPSGGGLQPLLHNAAHLVIYGVLAVLVFCALRQDSLWRRVAVACAWATLYGGVDELHQSYVPGRIASLGDVATDLAGAVLGVSCALWLWRRQPGTLRLAACALAAGCATVAFETYLH